MFLGRFGRLLNIFYIQGSFEAFYNIQEAFENFFSTFWNTLLFWFKLKT